MQYIDQVYTVFRERVPGKGEDSILFLPGEQMSILGAFDGCGGSGAKMYRTTQGFYKGAYFASRAVCGAVRDWFYHHPSPEGGSLAGQWERCIAASLRLCTEHVIEEPGLKSKMLLDFPTTAAIAAVLPHRDGVHLEAAWEGDSRLYLLDRAGLAELTTDGSAWSWGDGEAMDSAICAERPPHLSTRSLDVTGPCLVLAATDGAYGYFQHPEEFEWLLLDTLMRARTPEEWEQSLRAAFAERNHPDDVTLVLLSLGFGSFARTQRALNARYRQLWEEYLRPREEGTADDGALARRYQAGYQRYGRN